MVLTLDGATLVVAESMGGRLTAFDVAGDGSLGNRRVWADGLGPDGICIDAGGGICALGGPEGRTLFLLCSEFGGIDRFDEVLARRSARVEVVEIPAW